MTLAKYLFTVEDYHRLGKLGFFAEGDRTELIQGEIIPMSPIGTRHAACVKRLANFFCRVLSSEQAIIGVQDPIRLGDRSEPQPDLTLLLPRPDYYASAHPTNSDILLVLEVADTTLDYDRTYKIPLYAQFNIPETWLIDLNENCLEVYRQPTPKSYSLLQRLWTDQTISPLAFPDLTLNLEAMIS